MATDPWETTNRAVWRRPAAVEMYSGMEGWIDGGERAALLSVADEVRGAPLLEIGMGGGRVTSLLRLLSDRITAIDWAPEMVEACRSRYPDLDVRQGDARDLSAFNPEQFGLVIFSYNGIDNISHVDRLTVLEGVARVLGAGGVFVYCTWNRGGPGYGKPPWTITWRGSATDLFKRAVRFSVRFPWNLSRYRRMYRNWWRIRQYAEDHGDWAVGAVGGREFGLLQHFTAVTNERRTLEAAGFSSVEFFDHFGQPILSDSESATSSWFHAVARKPVVPA